LSPALPILTLTLTLVGAVCAALEVACEDGAGAIGVGVAISVLVSAESPLISGMDTVTSDPNGAGDDAGASVPAAVDGAGSVA
jgi:hypothetical protein